MKLFLLSSIFFLGGLFHIHGQSVSFQTFVNPVIPGDHPDPTLTRIGNDFYTSGSSFNPTPRIFHSTDLVHWKVIAQPVSAAWSQYGNSPGGGIWGGHMVLHKGIYWHFFGRGGGSMYFVTANHPEGPWSSPTIIQVPAGMSGLGVDNSIFIDDDTGKWYMLTKNGRENNHIVELGENGQPAGLVLDLTWLNPDAEGNPYGWAEGPVMWKHDGYYYYSFAEHLAGQQYVMRSDTLTDEPSAWTIKGDNIFTGTRATFDRPNHIAPVVMLDDSTCWTIAHSYHNSSSWYAQGRQGLLCQVSYDEQGFPVIQFPPDHALPAPDLPGSGIPWMVPKSDMFNELTLKPEWSFLGYTPDDRWSLTERQGWLYLEPYFGGNTIIQNDGEHAYSLITRMEFEPASNRHEAGLWIFNGPQTHQAKIFNTLNSIGDNLLVFRYGDNSYETKNTIGKIVWLKLIRNNHMISGLYSADGSTWVQIGESVNATDMDSEQTQFNNFTGNQQGLYVKGKAAFFDLYIYRDAYTPMPAECPANHDGTSVTVNRYPPNSLDDLHDNDWALYAGVEFGNENYTRQADSLLITAACASQGGVVEAWLDSLDTGTKIATCTIDNTNGWDNYQTFSTPVLTPVSGSHDLYLKFRGAGSDRLYRLQWLTFTEKGDTVSAIDEYRSGRMPLHFKLDQNHPNPFNPATRIEYEIPANSYISLRVYNMLSQEVAKLFEGRQKAGTYEVMFDGSGLSSGVYLCQMRAENFTDTIKLLLLK